MKIGVGVSDKQGEINWEKVKESKIDYAMLCCGQGAGSEILEESRFIKNAMACAGLGIPFGAYFYSRARDLSQGKLEAEYTIGLLRNVQVDYPVMLRLGDCDTTLTLKRTKIGDIAQSFCETMEQAGYRTGIYANKYWFSNLLTDVRLEQWERWVIQHYKECTYAGTYSMWQYTSGGKLDGVLTPVELSECYVDYKREGNEKERVRNRAVEKEMLPDLTGYVGVSLVGALNAKGYPSDFAHRQTLAWRTGLVQNQDEYKGSAKQNQELLRKLGGTISSSKIIREGTYMKLKVGSRNINTGLLFGDEVYGNTYQVISLSGVSVIFGIRGVVIGKVNRNSVIVV